MAGNDVVVAEKNATDPVPCVTRYPVTHSSGHTSSGYRGAQRDADIFVNDGCDDNALRMSVEP